MWVRPPGAWACRGRGSGLTLWNPGSFTFFTLQFVHETRGRALLSALGVSV